MLPAEISRLLKEAGVKQAHLAAKTGVQPATISQVISGRSRSAGIEEAIASAVGRPASDLWPQWYGADPKAPARIAEVDITLLEAVQHAYWQAADRRGDDPIVPLTAQQIGLLYNRCAGLLAAGASSAEKLAVAAKEMAYLNELGMLPRFELTYRKDRATAATGTAAGPTTSGPNSPIAGRDLQQQLGDTQLSGSRNVVVSGKGNRVAGRDLKAK